MKPIATIGLAIGLVGALAGCAGPASSATLRLRSLGLPPGMEATLTIDGGGHTWHLNGEQQTIRLPPGRYQVSASPTSSSGWEYRPAKLSVDVRVESGTVTELVEPYVLWPSAAPAGTIWGMVTNQTPDSAEFQIGDLACTSEQFCMAIGWKSGDPTGTDLYQWTWGGQSWSPPRDTGLGYTEVNGLTCPAADLCMMGTGSFQYVAPAAVDVWAGRSWVSQRPANPSTGNVVLYTAACATSSNCVAVALAAGTTPSELAEHWDGHTWQPIAAPSSVSTSGVGLVPWELVCPFDGTAQLCVLLSIPDTAGVPSASLSGNVAFWRNGSWQSQAAVQDGEQVGCRGSSYCLALGSQTPPPSPVNTVTYLWNGQGWGSPLSTAAPISLDDPPQCVSSTVCFVGGSLPGAGSSDVTQLLEWNGSSWVAVGNAMNSTGPAISPRPNIVACAPDDFCLDVGTAGTFALP